MRPRIETLTDLPGKQSVVAGAQAGPIAGGQIGLSRSEIRWRPRRPRKLSASIREDQLETLEIIASIKPSAPPEIRLILLRRHRKKHGRSILEYLAGWLANGKTSSRYQTAVTREGFKYGEKLWDDELNRYHLAGRMVSGYITGLGPVAAVGYSTRALERGPNNLDAIANGIPGKR